MDASTIVVISAALMGCMDGSPAVDGICKNGLPAFEATMDILKGDVDPKECPHPFEPSDAWRSCPVKWTAIVEIDRDGKPLFIMHPDGNIETHEGFQVDYAAKQFWEALYAAMPSLKVQ